MSLNLTNHSITAFSMHLTPFPEIPSPKALCKPLNPEDRAQKPSLQSLPETVRTLKSPQPDRPPIKGWTGASVQSSSTRLWGVASRLLGLRVVGLGFPGVATSGVVMA